MAGFDYAKMQGTASRLLNRFKQGSVILTVVTPGIPDPEEPWKPYPPTTATYELDAAVAAVTVDDANAKFVDGTTITSADLVVTCAVPPVPPSMRDMLTLDGVPRAIKRIVQIPSVGVPVAYKIFVQG